MKKGKYSWTIVAIAVLLTTATIPVYAQTADNTDDPDNFAEFIDCLFDGTGEADGDDTAQNIVDAIDGTAQSVPTEQEIRDCFEPIYEPATTTGGTLTGPTTGITDDESTVEEDGEDGEAGDEGVSEE